ncbi:MAG: ATP phosphoribosyltransferase regulatory subunit [Dehalococcoidia bacterium]|nr:ATP phosphoribosyltransferase regulatory subunit [Dehalococcoidia bacterium]
MRDMLPQDMRQFRRVEDQFRQCCVQWGYQEVRTPLLEYLHLFTATGTLTPDMLNRVYSFLDWDGWSGERVVLRPDGTIPAARLYITEMAQRTTARLFYVQDVLSFGATGTESREKWQAGVEVMGGRSPQAEVELVSLALEVLEGLGLKPELRLGHMGLLRSLLEELEVTEEEVVDRFTAQEGLLWERLRDSRPEMGEALALAKLEGRSPGFLENLGSVLLPHLPILRQPLEEFSAIARLLTSLDCPYAIDLGLGSGFEYYTGAVFHFYCGDVRVGGGGRYDNLIPLLGGKAVPATGFALYVDRIMSMVPGPVSGPPVLVQADEGCWPWAFSLAGEMRAQGIAAEMAAGEPMDHPGVSVMVQEGPVYILPGKGRFASPAEVVRVLKEGGDAEISPA